MGEVTFGGGEGGRITKKDEKSVRIHFAVYLYSSWPHVDGRRGGCCRGLEDRAKILFSYFSTLYVTVVRAHFRTMQINRTGRFRRDLALFPRIIVRPPKQVRGPRGWGALPRLLI